jgi:F0F1-type ATP synthase assembly protein I
MALREDKQTQIGWRMAGLGGEVASYLGAGLLLGWGFESWFGGEWWLIGGAIVGLVTGLSAMIKGALKLNTQMDAIEKAARESKERERS